jgi:heat-inducible transcriptional repressor
MVERRYLILREVVDRYIKTRKPVSSKEIVEEYGHPWCSATVRNELATLEREGYLYKPSPSAGRVPTAKGFRYFANWLLEILNLSGGEGVKRGTSLVGYVASDLSISRTISDLLRLTSSLISAMVSQVGFVISPAVESLRVIRVVLARLGSRVALFQPLTELGLAGEYVVSLSWPYSRGDFEKAEEVLEELLGGHPLTAATTALDEIAGWHGNPYRLAAEVLASLRGGQRRLYLSGLEHLTEVGRDVRHPLRLLSDEGTFVEMVLEVRGKQRGLDVHVGDFPAEGLNDFAMVSADFYRGLGVLGAFGPLWLDYTKAITTVRYMAGALSNLIPSLTAASLEGVTR